MTDKLLSDMFQRRVSKSGISGLTSLAFFSALAMACNLLGGAATPPVDAEALATQVAQSVAGTLAAAVTATAPPAPTALPTSAPTEVVIPPAVPPASDLTPDVTYALAEERILGAYAVRLWRNASVATDEFAFDSIATIEATGQTPIKIEMASAIADLTGRDITGEGNPDVIVETFTGGAHCCFQTIVFDLGPAATKVLETPQSNCGGRFEDLNGDGVYEFVTCDDIFAYAYCAYAASPIVKVIMQYEPGRGYVPASPEFADLYADDIQAHRPMAEQGQPGELGEWDNTNKCSVLPLVLDYLYSGQTDKAWSEFNRLYTAPDAAQWRAEIESTVNGSPLYAAPGR